MTYLKVKISDIESMMIIALSCSIASLIMAKSKCLLKLPSYLYIIIISISVSIVALEDTENWLVVIYIYWNLITCIFVAGLAIKADLKKKVGFIRVKNREVAVKFFLWFVIFFTIFINSYVSIFYLSESSINFGFLCGFMLPSFLFSLLIVYEFTRKYADIE